jgi:hypothetical protein
MATPSFAGACMCRPRSIVWISFRIPCPSWLFLLVCARRCCQQIRGGMKDKPGKPPDFYHTCYCLSGLSSAQHASSVVLGPRENGLKRADPAVNVVEERLSAARRWYAARPLPPCPAMPPAAATTLVTPSIGDAAAVEAAAEPMSVGSETAVGQSAPTRTPATAAAAANAPAMDVDM